MRDKNLVRNEFPVWRCGADVPRASYDGRTTDLAHRTTNPA